MVENTHTEDEKIREDSNEGLDSSSNVVVAVAFAFVAAFVAAAAVAVAPPPPLLPSPPSYSYCYTATETAALLPKWRRQHNFERRRPGFSRCLLPLGMI